MISNAAVVGSGPNGLAAAITLARSGLQVTVYEARDTVGGGVRSEGLTLPGYLHDRCSAVFPMPAVSEFFRSIPLDSLGIRWLQSPAALAHPLDGGRAAVFPGLGRAHEAEPDGEVWRRLFAPGIELGPDLFKDLLAPLFHVPAHPFFLAGFGMKAIQPATTLAASLFKNAESRALFAGMAAHSMLSLRRPFSSAAALVLGLAGEIGGWPIAAGGSQTISDGLARYFKSLGGTIETGAPIDSLGQVARFGLVLLDISAKQFARLAEKQLPVSYLRRIESVPAGPSVFKIDWALNSAVPWANSRCASAATVHVGGTIAEIAESEAAMEGGRIAEHPFVLISQPSLFDPSRAPPGKHTLWGYCHVPAGSTVDMTERIERQINRFAPGFPDCIIARAVTTPLQLESYNPNFSLGDISGGALSWPHLFRRPVSWVAPYRTPLKGVYLCSASTPPGPGVHGMCGLHAAELALRDLPADP